MSEYLIYNKVKFILLLLLKVFVSILFVGLALISQIAIDMISKQVNYKIFVIFIIISILYVIMLGFGIILKEYLTAKYCNKCSLLLKNDYIKGILNLHIYDYLTKATSSYFSVLTNDIGTISNNYFRNKLDLIDDIATFIVAFSYAIYIHYLIALFMFLAMLGVLILPLIIHKPFNRVNEEYLKYLETYTSICKNFFSGMVVIKSCEAERVLFSEIEKCHKKVYKLNNRVNYYTVLANNLPMALVVVLQLSSILLAGYLALCQLISVGSVMAILQISNSFYSPICQLTGRLSIIKSTKEINKSILDVSRKNLNKNSDEKLILEKGIQIKNLFFCYNEGINVIKNFSFNFKKGGKYLIYGESGSGKSTFLKLIAKILRPNSGEIYWDEHAYNEIDEQMLVSTGIGYVGQNAFIFNDSIRNNIDILREGDNEKLAEVIRVCKLSHWIDHCEKGVETVIDEEILQVSGGQKMRIALARILYLHPQVLLLDEITSALDNETSYSIESFILDSDYTVIHVAHKSSDILKTKYDEIINF